MKGSVLILIKKKVLADIEEIPNKTSFVLSRPDKQAFEAESEEHRGIIFFLSTFIQYSSGS